MCRLILTLMLFIGAIAATGCSRSYQLETAPVRGMVTLNGKPVSSGTVVFSPSRGRGATGQLAADGTFVLSTYGHGDGAIVGLNKVAVAPSPEDESGKHPPGYVAIPNRYQNSESSRLEREVKAGENNVFDLKLSTAP